MGVRSTATTLAARARLRATVVVLVWAAITGLLISGCMVGPDYASPGAPLRDRWSAGDSENVASGRGNLSQWWTVFEDPVLSRLVAMAYAQNLSLRAAGVRVLEAQARRAITIGNLFPQTQELSGSYTHLRTSGNTSIVSVTGSSSESFRAGFD